MLKIRCKFCNIELTGDTIKMHSCGCPNMTCIKDDVITANDLSLVEIITAPTAKFNKYDKNNSFLTEDDLKFQEQRKHRKIKKLEFEIR